MLLCDGRDTAYSKLAVELIQWMNSSLKIRCSIWILVLNCQWCSPDDAIRLSTKYSPSSIICRLKVQFIANLTISDDNFCYSWGVENDLVQSVKTSTYTYFSGASSELKILLLILNVILPKDAPIQMIKTWIKRSFWQHEGSGCKCAIDCTVYIKGLTTCAHLLSGLAVLDDSPPNQGVVVWVRHTHHAVVKFWRNLYRILCCAKWSIQPTNQKSVLSQQSYK